MSTYTNAVSIKIKGVNKNGNVSGSVFDSNGTLPNAAIPTSYESGQHTRKIAWRTVNGDYTSRLLSGHRKMIWKFEALREDVYYNLIEATCDSSGVGGLYGIQKLNDTDIFDITVVDAEGTGSVGGKLSTIFGGCASGTARFYLGEDTKFEFAGVADGSRYYSGEIHWIEATGWHYDYARQQDNNSNS